MTINLKIDAVILYADKTPSILDKVKSHLIKGGSPLKSNRTRDNVELKYLLRSLKHLSWLNNIYLVVAERAPAYLDPTKIRIVKHKDFFPKDWRLPSYNSAQIQSQVHKIQNLEERFLLLDDDFFFLKQIDSTFFFPDFKTIAVPRGLGTLSIDYDSKFDNTASYRHHNCNKYLPKTDTARRRFWHHAYPLTKSTCYTVSETYFDEIALMKTSTSRNRIRDVRLYELLYYSIYEGLVTSPYEIIFRDVDTCKASMAHLLDSTDDTTKSFQEALYTDPTFFSVNDDMGRLVNVDSVRIFEDTLETYFPEKSIFEF